MPWKLISKMLSGKVVYSDKAHAAGLLHFSGCCETNEPKHEYSFDVYIYKVTKERHSVRAASRVSLKVLRFERDLCELNRL